MWGLSLCQSHHLALMSPSSDAFSKARQPWFDLFEIAEKNRFVGYSAIYPDNVGMCAVRRADVPFLNTIHRANVVARLEPCHFLILPVVYRL